jgi:DNA-binding transcriptional MerR regulator
MASSDKDPGAFRTIGELSDELGVAQHVLRYWETRFTQLKPLQRAGNRRYYRPADVAMCRRIHHLLSVEGYTVKGVQKLLRDNNFAAQESAPVSQSPPSPAIEPVAAPAATPASGTDYERLVDLRDRLVAALAR